MHYDPSISLTLEKPLRPLTIESRFVAVGQKPFTQVMMTIFLHAPTVLGIKACHLYYYLLPSICHHFHFCRHF